VNNEGARRRLFFSQKGPPAFRRSPRTLRGATFCSCRRIFVSRRKIDSASCCPLPFFDSGRLNYGAKDNRAHPHQFYNRAFRNCSTYRKRDASWSPLSSARHFKLRARHVTGRYSRNSVLEIIDDHPGISLFVEKSATILSSAVGLSIVDHRSKFLEGRIAWSDGTARREDQDGNSTRPAIIRRGGSVRSRTKEAGRGRSRRRLGQNGAP